VGLANPQGPPGVAVTKLPEFRLTKGFGGVLEFRMIAIRWLMATACVTAIAATAVGASKETHSGIVGTVNRQPELLMGPPPEATNPQATVSVIGPNVARTTDSDEHGKFSFDELPPGIYRVEFKKESVSWSVDRVLVCPHMVSSVDTRDPRARGRVEGEAMPYRLRPPAGYRRSPQGYVGLYGQIRTPDQHGIGAISVRAENLTDHSEVVVMTSDSGAYEFSHLVPGAYRITISGPLVADDLVPQVAVLDGLELRLDREMCRRGE
jgi:hypothetical protein